MKQLSIFILILFLVSPVGAQPMGEDKATKVVVATVERKDFFNEVEALGTLKANESVDLTSTVTEKVLKVNFTDNQRVTKGDVLVEMDVTEERAQLEEAKSNLEEAQRQFDRLQPLAKSGAASDSELDQRMREVEVAKARIQAIEARISQRQIIAPFDGALGLRNISVGALAQPGVVIATIDDDTVMKLDFSVPSIFLSTTKPGVDIHATSKAFPDHDFVGTIAHVDSRIDPVTRSILVRALFDNQNLMLKPGLLMRVVLQKQPRKTIVIPEEAVIPDGDKSYVFLVVDVEDKKKVERRDVSLGIRKIGEVEILSGLEEGQMIVTHGTVRIRPGSLVEIMAQQKGHEPLTDFLKK